MLDKVEKIFYNPKKDKTMEQIEGLTYLEAYLSQQEADALWAAVYAEAWLGDLKRRVQHYGYKYDYKARNIDASMRIGNLPDWVAPLCQRLVKDGYFSETPDQLIVNEYLPGQGISPHIDCVPCFGDTIVSVSLGTSYQMDFSNPNTKQKVPVFLAANSAVVLQKAARYEWTHGIVARKSDLEGNTRKERGTRVSLTFRKVLLR